MLPHHLRADHFVDGGVHTSSFLGGPILPRLVPRVKLGICDDLFLALSHPLQQLGPC